MMMPLKKKILIGLYLATIILPLIAYVRWRIQLQRDRYFSQPYTIFVNRAFKSANRDRQIDWGSCEYATAYARQRKFLSQGVFHEN